MHISTACFCEADWRTRKPILDKTTTLVLLPKIGELHYVMFNTANHAHNTEATAKILSESR